ncbi:MAG: 50S ribosomal protein L10 [Candidatus Altiarchaeales archaeon]|nr:MAG: 50S ribosomal protein L10 [Candidatus Altiarchaeales archaeon]
MVQEWKIREVEDLANLISKSKSVALVSISNIPSKKLQEMRRNLGEIATLRISRNNLIKRALEKVKIKDMDKYIKGPTGLIFCNADPLKLKRILDDCKTTAPIKANAIAPCDIVVPAGETSLTPGPVLAEIQNVGIKAKIDKGKIVIEEDSLVARRGEKISEELANVLARLRIEPIEVSLKIMAAYEDGILYTPDVLQINDEKLFSDIKNAHLNAFNLAINSNIINSFTIQFIIIRAFNNARNLALNSEIINRDTIEFLLRMAYQQMNSLKSKISL